MTHFHLSVSAAVGFIALFGVAVQNGVIMVSYCDHLWASGEPLSLAVLDGAATRLRPVLMTALLASIGLVPAALSTGIGSDMQKPLAIAIIGGLVADVLMGRCSCCRCSTTWSPSSRQARRERCASAPKPAEE